MGTNLCVLIEGSPLIWQSKRHSLQGNQDVQLRFRQRRQVFLLAVEGWEEMQDSFFVLIETCLLNGRGYNMKKKQKNR